MVPRCFSPEFVTFESIAQWLNLLVEKQGTDSPLELARSLGIAVMEVCDPAKKWDGYLVRNNEAWAMIINSAKSDIRKTFTIAHEIVHFLIYQNTHINPANHGVEIEKLCDRGAFHLLFGDRP